MTEPIFPEPNPISIKNTTVSICLGMCGGCEDAGKNTGKLLQRAKSAVDKFAKNKRNLRFSSTMTAHKAVVKAQQCGIAAHIDAWLKNKNGKIIIDDAFD